MATGKRNWERIGVIVSLIGVIVSLVFSILNYFQNNKTENRQVAQERKQEVQYQVEKNKNEARDYFTNGEYDTSFKYYQEVIKLDSADGDGFRKFLNMYNILKANKKDWKQDSIIMEFFERAEHLKPKK